MALSELQPKERGPTDGLDFPAIGTALCVSRIKLSSGRYFFTTLQSQRDCVIQPGLRGTSYPGSQDARCRTLKALRPLRYTRTP
jgi:hypothetical protein